MDAEQTGTAGAGHLRAHVEVLSPGVELGFDGGHWYDVSGPDHFWMQWRLAAACRAVADAGVPLDAPLRVLEVGGGVGTLRAQLEAATAWTVDTTELDPVALTHVRPGRGRTLHYDVMDRRAELHHAYEALVLFDVLEHIGEPAPFLDALLWHLRPGGWLLVNVPALPSAHSRYDDAVGHFRRYSAASLRAELAATGVEVGTVRAWGLSLVPALYVRKVVLALAGERWATDDVVQRGFAPPNRSANRALAALGRAERALCGAPRVGTSLLAIGRAPA
jgi:2-polyprenyl-3-methyl-5-hydroxy-6-metoxy-1,4-benzoquinol methylase